MSLMRAVQSLIVALLCMTMGLFCGCGLRENVENGNPTEPLEGGKPKPINTAIMDCVGIEGSRIYFGVSYGNIYVLDLDKGEEIWSFRPEVRHTSISAPILMGNQMVFTAGNTLYSKNYSNGKDLWSLQLEERSYIRYLEDNLYIVGESYIKKLKMDGEELWKHNVKTEWDVEPVAYNGVIYFSTNQEEKGRVVAIDTDIGEEKWKSEFDFSVGHSVYADSNRILVRSKNGYIYALDSENGKTLWKFKTGNERVSALDVPYIITDGVLYTGSSDKYLYAIELESGKEMWKIEIGNLVYGPIAAEGNIICFSTDGNYVLAIDIREKKEVLKYAFEEGQPPYPFINNSVVYLKGGDGLNASLSALDINTGNTIWKYNTKRQVEGLPVIKDGLMYFGGKDDKYQGHLYAIDIKTGKEKWSFNY